MGRYTTGAITVSQAKKLDLTFLNDKGYLKQGNKSEYHISWSRGGEPNGSISVEVNTVFPDNYINLNYRVTSTIDNSSEVIDARVYLDAVKSNLGKGDKLYFICPVSGKRCSVLYLAYGSNIFKSREAYKNRIYYDCQIESKASREFRYFSLEHEIGELYKKRVKSHYKGIPTKLIQRIDFKQRLCKQMFLKGSLMGLF